ncbi:hypothetical protein NGM10_00515 [Halorussus salilacus]|uniref:hypothetical protein n=1 Tax=Halorussus salilacus TaxID=2953750 RepID=UPI0020A17CAF|nr:hypothetical protein [Halorussus salilacus]USZ68241.1 hypothetical protein NGM10_00515 [Halorussus salilacus]
MDRMTRRKMLKRGTSATIGLATLGSLSQPVMADNYGTVGGDEDELSDDDVDAQLSLEVRAPDGDNDIYDYESPYIMSFGSHIEDDSTYWDYSIGPATMEVDFYAGSTDDVDDGFAYVSSAEAYEESSLKDDYLEEIVKTAMEEAIARLVGVSFPIPDMKQEQHLSDVTRETVSYKFGTPGDESTGSMNPVINFEREVEDPGNVYRWMNVSVTAEVTRTYCDTSCVTENVGTLTCSDDIRLTFYDD